MGWILDEYIAKYDEEVVKKGLMKGDKYLVRPSLWITFRYLEDIGIEPWDARFERCYTDLLLKDPEMGFMVWNTIMMINQRAEYDYDD